MFHILEREFISNTSVYYTTSIYLILVYIFKDAVGGCLYYSTSLGLSFPIYKMGQARQWLHNREGIRIE